MNSKNVQQAFKVALALANPALTEKDWSQLKERFVFEDNVLLSIKKLINFCKDDKDMKAVLACLIS